MAALRFVASLAFLLLAVVWSAADDREPVARWALSQDAQDAGPNKLHATNRGVVFKNKVAVFDGLDSHLEVKPAPALRLGTGDFTLRLKLHAPEATDGSGDLVSLYDPVKRVGFNLALRTNTGVTTNQSNWRQLQFGIDSGSEPKWTDEGRPGTAIIAFALAVHDGDLYAGTAHHGKGETGRVYRRDGVGKWIDCGAPDKANAITALATFKGQLFAASSKYRFGGSALGESENLNPGGGVYRYEGGTKWTEVGRLPETESVGGLVVYRERLYASSLYKPAGFFRYEADGKWTRLPIPDGKRVESLGVFQGKIWATSYDDGRVYRLDGDAWKDLGRLGENTQTYSFAVHRGRLCVATWPSGKVYQWNEEKWNDLGRLGTELEVMGLQVHNGQLYGGTLPLAEVYRFDGGTNWTKIGRLDTTPDVKYRRAWTMAQFQGKLFCSTLPSGHIHSLEAGPCVTFDRELPHGWHDVAAVKRGGRLELFVDGKRVAESAGFDPAKLDLSCDSPLLIGAGAGTRFHGELADVTLFRRALDAAELAR